MTKASLSRTELLQELEKRKLEVTFIKKDGSTRVMKCTLNWDYITGPSKIEQTSDEDSVTVWDLEKQAIRRFNIPTLRSVKIL
jgi:WYL_2, Sm-like SH3 beta-barrel fold